MPKLARVLVAVAALLLLALYALPLWVVSLTAPQYPEGLALHIHVDAIQGATEHDLRNINNLNHYIGMRPIDGDEVPELRFMPWVVAGIVASGLLVAALGRRRPLYVWVGAFAVLGAVGLVDFWRWGYDYGHNLDHETAIIEVPGMTYQPPLIGTKHLLNFTATSLPGPGGWLAGLSFALGAAAVALTLRSPRAGGPPAGAARATAPGRAVTATGG
jgi:hypothetical protein